MRGVEKLKGQNIFKDVGTHSFTILIQVLSILLAFRRLAISLSENSCVWGCLGKSRNAREIAHHNLLKAEHLRGTSVCLQLFKASVSWYLDSCVSIILKLSGCMQKRPSLAVDAAPGGGLMQQVQPLMLFREIEE